MTNRFLAIALMAIIVSSKAVCSPFEFYGFLLPTTIVSSGAVESFSQPNMSAFTAAANPVLSQHPTNARSTFQLAQSRFGFLSKPADGILGRLEFDFIDFAKASPTTASLPRLRRAVVEWHPNANQVLRIGQDWDLVSPLAPHTFNLVGHYFESGDIGFMRNQVQWLSKSDKAETGFALGLPGSNNATSDGSLEFGIVPTFAVRETYSLDDKSSVGISALVTAVKKRAPGYLTAGLVNVFAELHFGSWEIKTEAYGGQNLFNLGLLGLSYGNDTANSIREAGAFVTAKKAVADKLAVFGGLGGAWILNPNEMLSSYQTVSGVSQSSATGPGIERNWTVRVGAEWKPSDNLAFFTEASALMTRHHLLAADSATIDHDRSALVFQLGSMLTL